jgi:hypothetical protein
MIEESIHKIISDLREIVRDELRAQGHHDTGSLGDTMRIEVKEGPDSISGLLWLNDYYVYIEYPMSASRVPFRRGSGAKSSEMLKGLIDWWRRKGASNPVAAAFATVNVWLREGRPTQRSHFYSRNGRRTGFLKTSIKVFEKDLIGKVRDAFVEETKEHFKAVFKSMDQFKLAS